MVRPAFQVDDSRDITSNYTPIRLSWSPGEILIEGNNDSIHIPRRT
jgi:hypothetical protein